MKHGLDYEHNHLQKESEEKCIHCAEPQKKWYKEKLFLVSLFIGIFLVISFFVSFLNPVLTAFVDYLDLIWWALLLGFFLGGVIDYLVPEQYIQKFLSKKKKRTIFYSVIFGFLMSACSHGILAIAIELYKKGASIPSVIAFLIASPWANLPITILLFGFFGVKAFFIIVSAVIIAVITGLVFQALDRKNLIEPSRQVKEDKIFSIRKDVKQRFQNYSFSFSALKKTFIGILKGSWRLTKMVLWWILIGMFFASLARAYISHEMFSAYLGATIFGLFITLILATIIEVCSEGTAPLAFEIFNQTGAFGNSFVFLMAGVATDYTEIGLLYSNIGKRTAFFVPLITVPQILVLGYLFNVFF